MAIQSAERVSQTDASDNYVFQRSMLAYCKAAEIVHGNVPEADTAYPSLHHMPTDSPP